jgi:hypothetical protein
MFDVTLSPAQTEYIVKPGGHIVHVLNVTNNSPNNLILNTSVKPWLPGPQEGTIDYDHAIPDPNVTFLLSNPNLKLGQPFSLPAHSQSQLILDIILDPKTTQKDSYYTLFVSQDPSALVQSADNNPQSLAQIGSHLFLTISETLNPATIAQVDSFQAGPFLRDTFFGTNSFNAKIINRSPYLFHTQGQILLSKNHKTVKTLNLFSDLVLAQHRRSIRCFTPPPTDSPTPPDQPPGPCQIASPLWPGIYTATLNLDPSLNSPPATATFIIFPFSLVVPLLLVGLLFLFRPRLRHLIGRLSLPSKP